MTADKLRADHEHRNQANRTADASGKDGSGQQASGGNNFSLPDFPMQELSIRMDKELNRVIVEVRDVSTKEVIRQIPAEGVVEALKQLRGTRGAILDEEG